MNRREFFALNLTFLMYSAEDDSNERVAHCLEMDVMAQEATDHKAIMVLKELIEEMIQAAVGDDSLDKILSPAPSRYWQLLVHAQEYKPRPTAYKRRIQSPGFMPIRSVGYAKADRVLVNA